MLSYEVEKTLEVVDFVSTAADEGTLTGTSSPPPVAANRLNAFKNMLTESRVLFEAKKFAEGIKQLRAVLQKCNGEHIDFVQGDARAETATRITNLILDFQEKLERDAFWCLKAQGRI